MLEFYFWNIFVNSPVDVTQFTKMHCDNYQENSTGWLVKLVKIARFISVSGLRNRGALRARLPCTAPVCCQFIGRLEHMSCGTEAKWSVDSSRIWTQDLQHLRDSGRRSNQLSYLLLQQTLGGQHRSFMVNYLIIFRWSISTWWRWRMRRPM